MLSAGGLDRLCRLMDRRRLIKYGFWGVLAVLGAVFLISLLDNGDDNSSSSEETTASTPAP